MGKTYATSYRLFKTGIGPRHCQRLQDPARLPGLRKDAIQCAHESVSPSGLPDIYTRSASSIQTGCGELFLTFNAPLCPPPESKAPASFHPMICYLLQKLTAHCIFTGRRTAL